MSIKVKIPAALRRVTGGAGEVVLTGATVSECIQALEAQFPAVGERLYDSDGQLRRFVNLYVNGEDVRFLSGMQTPVKAGDEVSIIPAVAGG